MNHPIREIQANRTINMNIKSCRLLVTCISRIDRSHYYQSQYWTNIDFALMEANPAKAPSGHQTTRGAKAKQGLPNLKEMGPFHVSVDIYLIGPTSLRKPRIVPSTFLVLEGRVEGGIRDKRDLMNQRPAQRIPSHLLVPLEPL